MCGRYGFSASGDVIINHFELPSETLQLEPRYNVAPGSFMPIIIQDDKKELKMAKWGLVPPWAKDIKIGFKMINARAETLTEKPSFKKPLKTQRCLIPASFFYEWKQMEDDKIPYLFKVKGEDVFAFAGLYEIAKDGDGKPLMSYTIITTDANQIMADVHNRMPVILKKADEDTWLNPDLVESDDILKLVKPFPSEMMEKWIVSKSVNSPKNDYPDLIKPEVNSL